MPIDWKQVDADHVREACEQYDAGIARPSRPSRSTFLLLNSRSYPAKFIRGLAYKIATGIELDPSSDYSGGDETVRFFAALGFRTTKDEAEPAATTAEPVIPTALPLEVVKDRKYEPQKKALFELLKKRFRTVLTEEKFPWLVVPSRDALGDPLKAIFDALEAMRGFSRFAVPGQLLRCDFVIPEERLIVEYDERQHFTIQRAKALELYPSDLKFGFDRSDWITACNSIRATDPVPLHRDEQRAFYDSLRDILAVQNGYRVIRFRQGVTDWTGSDAGAALTTAVSSIESLAANVGSAVEGDIKKIGLATHDCYNVPDGRGLFDYSEHFDRINKLCDEEGCDTILYALWTWDSSSPTLRTHDSVFGSLRHVQRVIVEVYDPPEQPIHVEVWSRGSQQPKIVKQRFSTSSASTTDKQQFLDDIPNRNVGSALLMVCGETNIASLVRGSDEFYDPFGFAARLADSGTRLILNPIHDYMRRYEMREKRAFYSRNGRTVVSVWNQGKKAETAVPWTVFHDGEELTDQVQELETRFDDRPDIRIGVFEMA